MKTNNKALTLPEYAAQFNKGQGKTTGAETGKKMDLVTTNIPGIVSELGEGFKEFALSSYLWKEANYGDLEGDKLEYIINHWLGRNHYNSVEGPSTVVEKNPLESPKKIRTALEYKIENVLSNNRDLLFTSIESLLNVNVDDPKITRKELADIVRTWQLLVWPEEKREYYAVMVEKEEEVKTKFKSLLDAGFEDITALKDGGFTARVNAVGIPTPIPETLGKNNYVLTDSQFDPITMIITVFFAEKTDETKEPAKI